MPRSFLVKKKRGACGAWQWKEPEQLEWKEVNKEGKNFRNLLNVLYLSTGSCNGHFIIINCGKYSDFDLICTNNSFFSE